MSLCTRCTVSGSSSHRLLQVQQGVDVQGLSHPELLPQLSLTGWMKVRQLGLKIRQEEIASCMGELFLRGHIMQSI